MFLWRLLNKIVLHVFLLFDMFVLLVPSVHVHVLLLTLFAIMVMVLRVRCTFEVQSQGNFGGHPSRYQHANHPLSL